MSEIGPKNVQNSRKNVKNVRKNVKNRSKNVKNSRKKTSEMSEKTSKISPKNVKNSQKKNVRNVRKNVQNRSKKPQKIFPLMTRIMCLQNQPWPDFRAFQSCLCSDFRAFTRRKKKYKVGHGVQLQIESRELTSQIHIFFFLQQPELHQHLNQK